MANLHQRRALLLILPLLWLGTVVDCSPRTKEEINIDREAREISFPARAQLEAFSRPLFQPGHHFIVSTFGASRFGALFNATVSDLDVRNALDAIGATAGENLLVETWTERDEADSAAPDLQAAGTRIEVLIEHDGKLYGFDDLIVPVDAHAKHQPEFRYVGNDAWRETFESGCIVCNYSCPGGAIANRNATIRDEALDAIEFQLREPFPIPDGDRVTVILRASTSASAER